MTNRNLRFTLNGLAFLALFFLILFRNEAFALMLAGICLLLSLIILLTGIPSVYRGFLDDSGIKTLREVTVFNLLLILSVVSFIFLIQMKIIQIPDEQESILAAMVSAVIVLVLENISPRLPFTRYTGLCLLWTVRDEDTWIAAYRILGYCSCPIGFSIIVTCFMNILPSARNQICVALFLLWIAVPAVISFCFLYRKTRQ